MTQEQKDWFNQGRRLSQNDNNNHDQTRQQGSVTHTTIATNDNHNLPPYPTTVNQPPQQPPPVAVYTGPEDATSASARFGSQGNNNKRKLIGSVTVTQRYINKARVNPTLPGDYSLRCRAEIDTRADTVCAGSTFLLHSTTGQVADVHGFHNSMQPILGVPIGTALTAVDTIILAFHQALYFGTSMEHSLIPPSQLWDNGITVDVTPKQYGGTSFGILDSQSNTFIPFRLHGCISYIPTRLPRPEEVAHCDWIHLTSDAEWDPYSERFSASERAVSNDNAYYETKHSVYATTHLHTHLEVDPSIATYDVALQRYISASTTSAHRSKVPSSVLAKRWGTSVETATQTLLTTTQRGVRYLEGSLDRRFRTRQRQLQNRWLNTKVYIDTLFNDVTSSQGCKAAQIFVTSEGFASGRPLQSKGDAYEALEEFCHDYGIPQLLVSDMANEEQLGRWEEEVRKQNLIKQQFSEPYSGWQNWAEDEIREFKKHLVCIMNLHSCPETL